MDNSFLRENILYYIAGFIVKKIISKLTCNGCIANIIKQNCTSSYTVLIDLKNKESLVYASNHVHKIVFATKIEYRLLLAKSKNLLVKIYISKNKLLNKNAYSQIMYRVTRKYALDTDIFPDNDDCYEGFEIGIDTPHRLQLINLLCRKYLTIRMYSYSKTLTKDVNPISKRQKLSKLILFNNT